MPRGATKTRGRGAAESGDAGGARNTVRDLRVAIGKLTGRKLATRAKVAALLGASPASIFNWERGQTEPSTHYLNLMREVREKADAGTLDVNVAAPRRGRRGRPPASESARAATGGEARTTSTGGRGSAARIEGESATAYANVVSVERGAHEVRIRFGLSLPGTSGARAIADLLVPSDVLAQLARR